MAVIEALESLGNLGWGNALIVLILCALIVTYFPKIWSELLNALGLETKKSRIERERVEEIKKLKEDVLALQQSADKFNQDRINDRAQSFQIQDHWTDLINKITDKQNDIVDRIDALAEQNRKYQLADMRETLLQAYRYYTSPSTNPLKMWTEMEEHAFNEQYEVYKANNGNSYMQHTVKPEMDKLHVVRLDDYETMAELMESRVKCRG